MWEKKSEKYGAGSPPPRAEEPRTAPAPDAQLKASRRALIGSSIRIKGDVTGSENLIVDGRVEGRIDLKSHSLTIGPNGRVNADIHVKSISIGGEVTGNVSAEEKLELTDSGRLVGDIRAPRIALAEGAHFNGSVHMEPPRQEKAAVATAAATVK
jgi:cytoskeletal protein CcmA (bactofilin family)